MARIKGVDIPDNKRIEIALTYIYGIGRSLSNQILNDAGVDINKRAKDLSNDELNTIIDEVFEIVKPESIKDLGKVMKEITPRVKNRCDMSVLNSLIREKLN